MSSCSFLKLGCARSEVSSPFTTHSQCPLVRWHLQSSRQDGSHAGQDRAKLSGLLSANLFQCGSTVGEPRASGASGHQIWSIHVVTTCGRDSSVGPWLTDPVIGFGCVFVCRPASLPSSLQLDVFVLCLRLYVLLSLCTSACSCGALCQKTWLLVSETGETCSEDRQVLGAASPRCSSGPSMCLS